MSLTGDSMRRKSGPISPNRHGRALINGDSRAAMHTQVRWAGIVVAIVAYLTFSSLLLAQVDRGGITGTVSDPSGARVPGAEVTITNVATNQPTKVTTDASGNFAANLLRIGTYSVTVEKQGFQKTIESKVEVGINQIVRLDLKVQVGRASESVEV